jgi:dsRNA-specific ribonuclease
MKRYKQKLQRIQSGKKKVPEVLQKYLVSKHGGQALFDLAVTLPTFAKDDVVANPDENHCRLEFLGDRVLELVRFSSQLLCGSHYLSIGAYFYTDRSSPKALGYFFNFKCYQHTCL